MPEPLDPYSLILDENIEHGVLHRLRNYGHDVKHVDFVDGLGKGVTDDELSEYSLETGRIVVTYDDDFVKGFEPDEYSATFYFADEKLSTEEVSDIIHNVSRYYSQEEVEGLEFLGKEWL